MVSMGQPENDKNKNNPWSSMIKPVEPVEPVEPVTVPVIVDPWERMKEIQRRNNEEISKLIEDSRKGVAPVIFTTPKTEDSPKRTEGSPWSKPDSPKRVDASSPWAGAPRGLWGKPKTSLPKLIPYAVLRLGILALILANIVIGVLFVSTYWFSNVILFTYLGASLGVLIHYFILMKYRDS